MDHLPDTLPIFPISGALLLPRGHLPLNIFEPRYLAMVDDALKAHKEGFNAIISYYLYILLLDLRNPGFSPVIYSYQK